MHIPGIPTFVAGLSLVGAAGDRLSSAANRGDELALVVKSTFVVDFFVPEQFRCGHAGYRELLRGRGKTAGSSNHILLLLVSRISYLVSRTPLFYLL
jgi:hypothetical protein